MQLAVQGSSCSSSAYHGAQKVAARSRPARNHQVHLWIHSTVPPPKAQATPRIGLGCTREEGASAGSHSRTGQVHAVIQASYRAFVAAQAMRSQLCALPGKNSLKARHVALLRNGSDGDWVSWMGMLLLQTRPCCSACCHWQCSFGRAAGLAPARHGGAFRDKP